MQCVTDAPSGKTNSAARNNYVYHNDSVGVLQILHLQTLEFKIILRTTLNDATRKMDGDRRRQVGFSTILACHVGLMATPVVHHSDPLLQAVWYARYCI